MGIFRDIYTLILKGKVMIIWLTGPKYADMVRIAEELQIGITSVVLYFHTIKAYKLMAGIAKSLSKQTTIIVCGGANTIDKRYKISNICNPVWVHVRRNCYDDSYYEEPDPVKDTCEVHQDVMSVGKSVACIRYITGYSAPEPCTILIGDFQRLTDSMCNTIRDLAAKGAVVVALRDLRKTSENPSTTFVMSRIRALNREFGTSIKVITIPYAEKLLVERYGVLVEV